jgi:hypothetical protein
LNDVVDREQGLPAVDIFDEVKGDNVSERGRILEPGEEFLELFRALPALFGDVSGCLTHLSRELGAFLARGRTVCEGEGTR